MASNPQKGLYDPFDLPNRKYRGYIGYQDPGDQKYYSGLKPGESILVDIPLVYWDCARVHIRTEAEFIWRFGDVNNPLRHRATARRSTTLSALPEDSTPSNSIAIIIGRHQLRMPTELPSLSMDLVPRLKPLSHLVRDWFVGLL